MKDNNLKKQAEEKGGVNTVAAAVAGVVVGAGVVIAGAVALKDEENRKKVKNALSGVKDRVVGYAEDVQKAAADENGEVGEKIAEGKAGVKEVLQTK